jgi:hypothetical protein
VHRDEGEWPPSEELAHRVTEAKERLYAQLTNTMGIRAFEGTPLPAGFMDGWVTRLLYII